MTARRAHIANPPNNDHPTEGTSPMTRKKTLTIAAAAAALAATMATPAAADAAPRRQVVPVIIQADGSNAEGARLAMAEWNANQIRVELREQDRCWRQWCIIITEVWDAGDWHQVGGIHTGATAWWHDGDDYIGLPLVLEAPAAGRRLVETLAGPGESLRGENPNAQLAKRETLHELGRIWHVPLQPHDSIMAGPLPNAWISSADAQLIDEALS